MKFSTGAVIFAAGLSASLVASAPAVLLDAALDRASGGRFHLALAEGTLWNGEGRLAIANSSESLSPIARLRWEFAPSALMGARLRWQLAIDGSPPTTLEIGSDGIVVRHFSAQLPPAVALSVVPHAIARAGWRGVLDLRIPEVICRWGSRCEGVVVSEWRAGGSDILPRQAFGDHRITATLSAQVKTLEIVALHGLTLNVNGKVEFTDGKPPRANVEIHGDAQLLDRLHELLHELGAVQDGSRLLIRS